MNPNKPSGLNCMLLPIQNYLLACKNIVTKR